MPDNREEPAFPEYKEFVGSFALKGPGLTKREWFAGMAMQGFCSLQFRELDGDVSNPKYWAKASYAMADAMLAASKEVKEIKE